MKRNILLLLVVLYTYYTEEVDLHHASSTCQTQLWKFDDKVEVGQFPEEGSEQPLTERAGD